jgi:hypothetical protein
MRMHIVVIAWLFVTFTMALTMGAAAGIAFFSVLGVAPVMLYGWMIVRRRAAARRDSRATAAANRDGAHAERRGDDGEQGSR